MNQTVLVVGAGAIGGILCAYLEERGQAVSLFARGENARLIAKDGIHLTTPGKQQLHARPRVITTRPRLNHAIW